MLVCLHKNVDWAGTDVNLAVVAQAVEPCSPFDCQATIVAGH